MLLGRHLLQRRNSLLPHRERMCHRTSESEVYQLYELHHSSLAINISEFDFKDWDFGSDDEFGLGQYGEFHARGFFGFDFNDAEYTYDDDCSSCRRERDCDGWSGSCPWIDCGGWTSITVGR
jgi:hypothetical protein